MEDPGQRLRKRREELSLRYRDVEEASREIAARHGNNVEYEVGLSRLADIENRGTVPSIYKLYSLCAIYRLDMVEVLEWYGVTLAQLPADAASLDVEKTHMIGFSSENGHGDVQVPLTLDPGIDLRKTTYLSRMIQRWGKLPLLFLNGLELRSYRYAYIGTEDWMMYPLLQPGSLILIDETRRKIVTSGWASEFERPIYFLEHRGGYSCAWCQLTENTLILQPHPASHASPQIYAFPEEIDVVGQVTGVAMRLDLAKKRRARS